MNAVLFYEDNSTGKRNWLIIFSILTIFFVGLTTTFVQFLVNPYPEDFGQNIPEDILLKNIPFIIFLSFFFVALIAFVVFRFKNNRFKQSIEITSEQFCFTYYKNDKDIFNTKDFASYEIIGRSGNWGIVRLFFANSEIMIIRCRKLDYLLSVLYQILKQNYERNNTDVNQKA